jgi:hypothetical protein
MSARAASTDYYSNESETLRSSPLRQSRTFQEAVANGAVATLPVFNSQAMDTRPPVTTPDPARMMRSVVPRHATGSGRVPIPFTNYECQATRTTDQWRTLSIRHFLVFNDAPILRGWMTTHSCEAPSSNRSNMCGWLRKKPGSDAIC